MIDVCKAGRQAVAAAVTASTTTIQGHFYT